MPQSDPAVVKAHRGAWGHYWVDPTVVGVPGSWDQLTQLVDRLLGDAIPVEQTLKHDATRSIVELKRAESRTWVVKRYRTPFWRTLIQNAARQTPAWREWRGGRLLRSIGRRANPAMVLADGRPRSAMGQALIFPYVDGHCLAHVVSGLAVPSGWRDDTGARRVAVARCIGEQLGAMIAAGVINRDHKISNLICDEACVNGAEPVIIDPVGVVPLRNQDQIERVLAMMVRTTLRHGPFSAREGLALLRGMASVEPSGLGRPLARWARAVTRRLGSPR